MHHGTALIPGHQAAWNLLLTSPAAVSITTRPGFTFSRSAGWVMMLLKAHPANLLRQLWCNRWTFLSIPSNHNLLLPDHNLKTNNLMQLVQCTRLTQEDHACQIGGRQFSPLLPTQNGTWSLRSEQGLVVGPVCPQLWRTGRAQESYNEDIFKALCLEVLCYHSFVIQYCHLQVLIPDFINISACDVLGRLKYIIYCIAMMHPNKHGKRRNSNRVW